MRHGARHGEQRTLACGLCRRRAHASWSWPLSASPRTRRNSLVAPILNKSVVSFAVAAVCAGHLLSTCRARMWGMPGTWDATALAILRHMPAADRIWGRVVCRVLGKWELIRAAFVGALWPKAPRICPARFARLGPEEPRMIHTRAYYCDV